MARVRAKGHIVAAGRWGRVGLIGALPVLATLAFGVGSASALPLPPLTINGSPPTANGPTVNAELDLNGDGEYTLTVSFPGSNAVGDEITAVSGQFNTAAYGGNSIVEAQEETGSSNTGPISFFTQSIPCGAAHGGQTSFSCPNFYGGFGPGGQQSYVIDTSLNEQPNPLSSINITVAECGQTNGQAIAADMCAPPGPTKITRAHIDAHAGTATFHYRARHATHYQCELFDGHKLKFRAHCGSTKRYSHHLPHGHYTFVVWGVNAGGGSARAAMKRFRVHR